MTYAILVPVVVALLLLAVGALGWFGVSLDLKVRPGDVLSVFTTTFLALLLQNFIAKRNKQTDSEKQLILKQLSDVASSIKLIKLPVQEAVANAPITSVAATSLVHVFEDCIQELGTLEVVVENSHCSNLSESCLSLSNLLLRYKTAMTNGDFPNRVYTGVDVEKSQRFQRHLAKEVLLLNLSINRQ